MNPPGLDLKAIFCEALDHPNGPGRAAYLDRACREDAALRQQVESLLGAHDDAGGFLGSTPRGPATAPAPDTEMPPDHAPVPGDDPTLSVHRRALVSAPSPMARRVINMTPTPAVSTKVAAKRVASGPRNGSKKPSSRSPPRMIRYPR